MTKPNIRYAEDEEWEDVAKAVWRLNPNARWAYKNGWRSIVVEMKLTGAARANKNTLATGTGGWEVSIHKVKGGFYLRPCVATCLALSCVRQT